MRADAHVVKNLFSRFGADAARSWQRAPLVEVSDPAITGAHPQPLEPFDAIIGDDALPAPWDPFAYMVPAGDGFEASIFVWVGSPDHFQSLASHVPPVDGVVPQLLVVMPVASTAICGTVGRRGGDGTTVYSFIAPRDFSRTDREVARHHWETVMLTAHLLVRQLTRSPQHLTEVRAARPRSPAGTKTARLKPWLRDDLSRIILLDPTTAARRYGMPSSGDSGRKTPVPHGRRGHRRTLGRGTEAERTVWVRPAWIGPEAWESQGQCYRVLSTAG